MRLGRRRPPSPGLVHEARIRSEHGAVCLAADEVEPAGDEGWLRGEREPGPVEVMAGAVVYVQAANWYDEEREVHLQVWLGDPEESRGEFRWRGSVRTEGGGLDVGDPDDTASVFVGAGSFALEAFTDSPEGRTVGFVGFVLRPG